MKGYRKLGVNQKVFIVIAVTIPVISFIMFWLIPKFNMLLQAFQVEDNRTGKYVFSLDNFKNFFIALKNPESIIVESVTNTLIAFVWSTFLKNPLCLLFSYFLYKKISGYKIFRWVFFMPSIISGVVVSGFVTSFLGVLGPLPKWVELATGVKPMFFQDERYAWNTLLVVNLWSGFGAQLLYYMSAMVRIPDEVVEAGRIDGLSIFGEFVYITIPLIWPTISTLLLLAFTGIWSADVGSLLYTQGQAGTSTLSFWIYENTVNANYNYVSAIGLFFTTISIPLIIFVRWLTKKIDTVTY